ncbi:hypothetical protein [Actinoallomurus sp. NPDC050550]|uniref:hypothetical protein n=1 Tax=Actinoallomurus sp. NPDC050550 TaxID=3154937 RepID=UPI00340A9C59
MSERQDRPEGRHALPGDRPVAGMPSDDAVEGRVVGSSGERTGHPGDATAGPAAGAIVPPQPGPVTDTGGRAPLPRRTRETDRDRDERTRPEGSRGVRPDAPGTTDTGAAGSAGSERLLGRGDADRFETRWHEVKAGFVDDPRDSVRQAGSLCEEAVRALTAALDEQRRSLEQRWQGDDADTERLRITLRAYGDLLQRLVTL